MEQWDAIRLQVASGHDSDGPRLWFEGVLDDHDLALADAERRAREWRNAVAINIDKAAKSSPF
jgi:hypothetical protein